LEWKRNFYFWYPYSSSASTNLLQFVSVSVSLDKRMEGEDRKLTPSAATLHKPSIFMPYQNIMCCCNAPAGGLRDYTAEA